MRSPLVPTASVTRTVIFFGLGGLDVGVGVGVDGAGVSSSFEGGSVEGTGVAPGTCSRYQAAANPSLPPGSRTRTHWLIAPIFEGPSGSSKSNCVPAGTDTTTFAMLDVSMLERTLSPQVTSALTRAEGPPVVVESVPGVEGIEIGPPDP